jgi:hypothetical protein
VVVNSFWRHHDGTQGRVGELFLGSKGRAQPGTIWDRDGNELWKYSGPRVNGQQVEQDELVRHIREDKPINMAEDAANSTMTALLGRQACYSGNSIPWSRGLAAKDKMVPDADDFNADVPAKPGPDGLYPTAVPGKYNPLDPFA